jgi:SAM-dependent methyltransferase
MRTSERYAGYELLAHEYYDPILHPTSANFRAASESLLRSCLPETSQRNVLDAGAGRSLVAELMLQEHQTLQDLVALDSSPHMLSFSNGFRSRGIGLLLGDCRRMPLSDESFDIVVSILGDPYNGREFWREVRRVLEPGGVAIFTTPAYDWAVAFRSATALDVAEFVLVDDTQLQTPSFVYPNRRQRELIEAEGLLIKEVLEVPIAAASEPHSPKLLDSRGPNAPIVTGYVATKG